MLVKPSFHTSGKSQTVGDFTDFAEISGKSPDLTDDRRHFNFSGGKWGTGAKQFRGLVTSLNCRRRPRQYTFEVSYVGNDRRPSQKSGTRRENRNTPDFPDLSATIPHDRGCVRFPVKSPIVWDFPDI